ncbi:hypothetical protein Sjap_020072 [Stephania japonica]|uniref:peptidylprolyl isomerase n=1 Tax=Stephania japonica TaxID=461633 RepID=A0AAP0F7F1_9MAGN
MQALIRSSCHPTVVFRLHINSVDLRSHVSWRAQTTSYRKSKEFGRAMGDSPKVGDLHDEAWATQTPDVTWSLEVIRNPLLLFKHCIAFSFSFFCKPIYGVLATPPAFGSTNSKKLYDERRLLEQNKRIQKANNTPEDFPNFVRQGFQVQVVTSGDYVRCDSGLIYLDIRVGNGEQPKDGQQVTFHYVGYNESGRRIDSTYLQGSPAKIRMGTKALVPDDLGFEEGIRDMKPGGKRRIIIPPELGPPVGPSTFFSSKQFEVFDVELLSIQDCQRRTIGFYSDVVCN